MAEMQEDSAKNTQTHRAKVAVKIFYLWIDPAKGTGYNEKNERGEEK